MAKDVVGQERWLVMLSLADLTLLNTTLNALRHVGLPHTIVSSSQVQGGRCVKPEGGM